MNNDWKSRITLNPAVLVGKPTIRGMRISVEQVLRALAGGISETEILQDYPDLEIDDLRVCQNHAADLGASDSTPLTNHFFLMRSV
jgi:uncharacterized protein (DUF433 family)